MSARTSRPAKLATIKPVPYGSLVYNASDAPGHHRGDMGRGKPKAARVYAVHRIDSDGTAHCQSRNAWGQIHEEAFPVHTLAPWRKPAAPARSLYSERTDETRLDDHDRPCTEIRTLPYGGGGNILVGRASYEQEMRFRRERIRAGVPFDLPTWESLAVYWKAGQNPDA